MAQNDPHSYTDTDQGRIRHADLTWDVDFEKKKIAGEVILTLKEPLRGAIDLDTRDLEILKATDDRGKTLKWTLGDRDPILGQRLRITSEDAIASITISYATSPKASALQWLEPSNTAGRKLPYLFSQCQSHHARSIVPLQDSPAVRFSYRATVTVPKPLTAVMSAAPGREETKASPGKTTYTFEMPQPIPSYLVAIAVGSIAHRDLGPRTRVYAEPETLDAAAWEFEPINSMLSASEKLFGPYLWDRYDFIVLPPAFPYGGMENPRLTFLTPTLLAGDRSLVNVLCHELAHSWTGNLVTNASMNDFWLNEGFTVWAEQRILEALEGKEALALASTIGRQELQEDMKRFGEGSPYTCLKHDLKGVDPDDIYSQVPYQKGCSFVTLLEQTVGREKWGQFIQQYIERFKFTSITTEEFLAFLEEKLPGLAKKVDAQEWIYKPGLPKNAPEFESKRLNELKSLAAGWPKGARPDPEKARKWPVREWLVYLGELPKKLPHEDCRWLDESFRFSESRNAEFLNWWCVLAANSAYEPAYPKIREFLGSVGRMKFLKPIYRALFEGEKTRPLALEIFKKFADRYHPIARGGLEAILKLRS
ncbi:MAG: M1 family metallopeptidase [Pseudomonadota bacterium]